MPDKSTRYGWFRLVGRITLVVLRIILLFMEIVKRYSEILSALGARQISFGKSNSFQSGNGIALFNARKDIESINGSFKINSTINKFTEVEIAVPLTKSYPLAPKTQKAEMN